MPDKQRLHGIAALSSSDDIENLQQVSQAVQRYAAQVRACVAALCQKDGAVDVAALNLHQHIAHGYAWIEAYAAAIEATENWAQQLESSGRYGTAAQLIARIGIAEYVAQLAGGVAMSQDEFIRPADFGLQQEAAVLLADSHVVALMAKTPRSARTEFIALLKQAGPDLLADLCDDDSTLALVRSQFRSFANKKIAPFAQAWHREDALIPIDVIEQLAALGVFGLTAPEEYGGSGLGVAVMCAVTEELSRGYLGAGSLGTRSEIAVELIRNGGSPSQKARWLRPIIAGEMLPAAVFTEPGAGSDLAALTARAERHGDSYRLFGAKTWITHAARADVMLVLARTGAAGSGHRGLSMFIVEKPRGTDDHPFPSKGLRGSEIPVLGYRGMKEYELAFDGLEVPADALLGEVEGEGEGFRQLMATFELARIQTAARAIGVAQNAFELACSYATERQQFGTPVIAFPRVHNKLAWMAIETMMVRQLVLSVAQQKQAGGRCDVEAGMAKLLAARVAWSAADNALQIHGGNGYALEYPISRVLCDARILNIFEGAAEIQAQVIARGLMAREAP